MSNKFDVMPDGTAYLNFTYWKNVLVEESIHVKDYRPGMTGDEVIQLIKDGKISRDNMSIDSGLSYDYDTGESFGEVRLQELESDIDWDSLEILTPEPPAPPLYDEDEYANPI